MKRKYLLVTTMSLLLLVFGALFPTELAAREESSRCETTETPDMNMKNDDHSLSDLWEKYQTAAEKDLPEEQLSLLKEIIEQSGEQKQAWDFYSALQAYQAVAVRKDWKKRDEVQKEFKRKIKEFDLPVLSFLYQMDYGEERSAQKILEKEAERLQKGKNRKVWKESQKTGSLLNGHLPECILDDYEFCLWVLSSQHFNKWKQPLEQHIGDRYPGKALIEWMDLQTNQSEYPAAKRMQKKEALLKMAEKYSGKAFSLYARENLLHLEMDDLERNDRHNEAAFKKIHADSKQFLSDLKRMKASERKLYGNGTSVRELITRLESPTLRIQPDYPDSLHLFFSNLTSARLTVQTEDNDSSEDKKVLLKQKVKTEKKSFYVEEKVSIALPKWDDGTYSFRLENGKTHYECTATCHTLSVAARTNRNGEGIYITRHESGEPLEQATLRLIKSGEELAKVKDFQLDEGFTTLPRQFTSLMKGDSRYYLEAEYEEDGRIRKSEQLDITLEKDYPEADIHPEEECEIFLDQGAYRPGDIVHFKAVLYEGDPYSHFKTQPAGTRLVAELRDTEGQLVSKLEKETDDFGAAAGDFTIPEGLRNGQFLLTVLKNGRTLCCHHFRVDQFVLPEFSVQFQKQEEVYAYGDEVKVKGKVQSYSGHPTSGAEADYQVFSNGRKVAGGKLDLDDSGEFRIRFRSQDKRQDYGSFYHVQLRVTGNTGETHEYNTTVFVCGRITLDTRLENETEADISLSQKFNNRRSRPIYDLHLIQSDEIRLKCEVTDQNTDWLDLRYHLLSEQGDTLATGDFKSSESIRIDWKNLEDGLYLLGIDSQSGRKQIKEAHEEMGLVKLTKDTDCLNAPLEYLFSAYNTDLTAGNRCGALLCSNEGETWAVAEWYGTDHQLLESRTIHLDEAHNMTDLAFEFKPEYPERVNLQVFYFKKKGSQYFQAEFKKPQKQLELPLEWVSFQDKTTPGTEYSFTLQTLPGAQCLVAIYDKSLDEIQSNRWNEIRLQERFYGYCPIRRTYGNTYIHHNLALRGTRAPYLFNAMASDKMAALAESEVMQSAPAERSDLMEVGPDTPVRSDMATSLTFQPFLQADENGLVHIDFQTRDKLSTFVVSVFAHDKEMNNKVLRKEMTVTIPLKISVSEPTYLFDGDEWKMKVAVSSNLDKDISGTLSIGQYAGKDFRRTRPFKRQSARLDIPAGGSEAEVFEITVDLKQLKKLSKNQEPVLGIKAEFISDDRKTSDGLFLQVPVYQAKQVIEESHSALWRPGQNKKALYRTLQSRFTNGSGSGAEYKELSILDMIQEAIPKHAQPKGKDVLSCADALYIQLMAKELGQAETAEVEKGWTPRQLLDKILDCRNQDGGFGWFEGMTSSPIITATLLERFAKLSRLEAWKQLGEELDWTASVKYLDQTHFNLDWPYWRGNISLAQYLQIRSLYPGIPFAPQIQGSAQKVKEQKEQFQKEVQEYLVPEKDRGLTGQIFEKARRLLTLTHLSSSEAGQDLAKAWGIGSTRKLEQSLQEDVFSLLQYAVRHQDGGWYYPNLVLPFRGLLESEAYAHAMMCELLEEWAKATDREEAGQAQEIADGIRLWLMIQKESQHWKEDSGFIDAIDMVMKGSSALKQTSVLVLTQRYEKPLDEVKASGNGMTVTRKFYKESTNAEGKILSTELEAGTVLEIGDVIRAKYLVHNDENRSFGKLTAWREAGLIPAEQRSGLYGWGIRPYPAQNFFRFTPISYRDVRNGYTLFYLDVMPEEDFELEEVFYVTRAGIWQAPAVEVESMYAPHYRANDASNKTFCIK